MDINLHPDKTFSGQSSEHGPRPGRHDMYFFYSDIKPIADWPIWAAEISEYPSCNKSLWKLFA